MLTVSKHRAVGALVAAALCAESCLSASYRISSTELARLSRTPPDQRWQAVRATQQVLGGDHPPDQVSVAPVTLQPVLLPQWYLVDGRQYAVPTTWHRRPRAPGLGVVVAGSAGRSSSSRSGSGGSSSGGGDARGAAVVVAVVVVAAAVMVFVLAATEGARWDGWVGLPPDELVYLELPEGLVAAPLSGLTPELTDRARGATVYEGEEGRYLQLARAPLDRRGFAVQSAPQAAWVPNLTGAGDGGFGFGGRTFLGGFPVHQLGVGAAVDVMATTHGHVLANVGVELQAMPVTWAGVYAGAGWSWASVDGPPSQHLSGWYARGGAQFELPLTTRLSAVGRLGVQRIDPVGRDAQWAPEASVGLSVY